MELPFKWIFETAMMNWHLEVAHETTAESVEKIFGILNPILEIANGNLILDKDVQFLILLTVFRP